MANSNSSPPEHALGAVLERICGQLGQANRIAATRAQVETEQLKLAQRQVAVCESILDLLRASQVASLKHLESGGETLREVVQPILQMLTQPRERRPPEQLQSLGTDPPPTVERRSAGMRVAGGASE